MKLKKILAVLSSAALMSTLTAQVASARSAPETSGTYHYVALGDSIGSGYGLEPGGDESFQGLMQDHALIINEDLLADPVDGAFPAVFGSYLEDALYDDYDWDVSTTNLCATAYRAEDVAKVLKEEGYIGAIAMMLINMSNDPDITAQLENYHNIFVDYLRYADLVSIELGGDDMLMTTVLPMLDNNNPVLKAMGMGMILTLIGQPTEVAFGAAVGTITKAQEQGKLTEQVLAEAAQYMQNIAANADNIADSAANFVAETIDAVREISENDPDIAVLSMFNPYGTPNGNGRVSLWGQNTADVAQALYAKASEEYTGRVIDSVATYKAGAGYVSAPTLASQQFDADINDLQDLIDSMDEESKEQIREILNRIADEIALPMVQMMAAETVDPQIKLLNSKLKAVADDKGCVYVDTYGITSDGDFDPHPDANGHKEIADRMWDTLERTVRARLGDDIEDYDPDPVGPAPIEIDGDYAFAEEDITIKTGSTKQLVIYDKNGRKANDLDGWKFYSTNEDAVYVDENTGMIKALKAGRSTIHAVNVYDDTESTDITCNINVVSVFPPAYVPSGTTPTTEAVARDKVTGYATFVADSSSTGPIAATGGELGSEENDTPAVVAASVLGVIALGFVVVSRKRRHS